MPNFGHIVKLWPIPIDIEFYKVTENALYHRGKHFYYSGTAFKNKCKPNFTVFEEMIKQGLEATRVTYRSASHASKPILFLSEPNRISAQPSGHLKRACAVNRGSCLDKR